MLPAMLAALLVCVLPPVPPAPPQYRALVHDAPRAPQGHQDARGHRIVVSGAATWFAAPHGTAAAGPALRRALGRNWRGTVVAVTANGHTVRVRLTDWMRADRLIDLNPTSFVAVCGPLSRGVCRVTVARG